MAKKNIELIRQALGAAESSIKLAKQLLSEMEKGAPSTGKDKVDDLPGVVGVFDGESMVSSDNQAFPVPANYASKSMLVVGDTLKLVDEGKEKRFKQIEHVKRYKTTGVLTKKDGKWRVVTPEGSYKVLPAAVAHFAAEVGSEVVLHLPSNNLTVAYGAIESVKDGGTKAVKETSPAETAKEEVKDEKKKESTQEKVSAVNTTEKAAKSEPETKPVKKEDVKSAPAEKPVVTKEASEAPKAPEEAKEAPTSTPSPQQTPPATSGEDELT